MKSKKEDYMSALPKKDIDLTKIVILRPVEEGELFGPKTVGHPVIYDKFPCQRNACRIEKVGNWLKKYGILNGFEERNKVGVNDCVLLGILGIVGFFGVWAGVDVINLIINSIIR